MATGSYTLERTNWREYAYATDAVRRQRANLAFNHSPLLAMVASETLVDEPGSTPMAGMGRNVQTGGPAILRYVTLGKHAGAARVSGGFGEHTLAPDDNERPSEINWKFYNHALVVSEHDLEVNAGDTQIANFLDRQTTQVMTAMADIIADDLYAETTPPNGLTGLPVLLNANDTAQSLDGQTFLDWNTRGLATVGTAPSVAGRFTSGSFAAQGLSDMRRLVNNSEEGGVACNVILTEYDTVERYEATLQPQERFTGAVRVADGSFASMAFRGRPVLPDRKCTSGHMFALLLGNDTHGIIMELLNGAAFRFSDWKPSQSQTAMVRPLRATCNLTIGNRKFGSNKMNSITD